MRLLDGFPDCLADSHPRQWQPRTIGDNLLSSPGKISPLFSAGTNAKVSETVSVVIPVYNEASNLAALWARLEPVLNDLGRESEVVFVDDGSSDDSLRALREFATGDARVRVVELARNFGQHSAILAGFRNCRGDIVVTLDADLQNPPEDIPRRSRRSTPAMTLSVDGARSGRIVPTAGWLRACITRSPRRS